MEKGDSLKWDGSNCIDFADFLGHHDFHHKAGVLLIQTCNGTVAVKKGETVVRLNNSAIEVESAY